MSLDPAFQAGWITATSKCHFISEMAEFENQYSRCPSSYTLINQNFGFTDDALDSFENFKNQLFAIKDIKASDEGVFNLPVCVINQMSSVPECEFAFSNTAVQDPLTLDQTNQCYSAPINCLGGRSFLYLLR